MIEDSGSSFNSSISFWIFSLQSFDLWHLEERALNCWNVASTLGTELLELQAGFGDQSKVEQRQQHLSFESLFSCLQQYHEQQQFDCQAGVQECNESA